MRARKDGPDDEHICGRDDIVTTTANFYMKLTAFPWNQCYQKYVVEGNITHLIGRRWQYV